MTSRTLGQLTIPAAPFHEAFRKLSRLIPRRSQKGTELLLTFEGDALRIHGPGAIYDMNASGKWPGRVRVSAGFIKVIGLAPTSGDSVVLEYADRHLIFRGSTTLRITASWEDISHPILPTTLQLSDIELLKLMSTASQEAITSSGLFNAARNAELRFQRVIDKAYPIFSIYRCSRSDLESALRDMILRIASAMTSERKP